MNTTQTEFRAVAGGTSQRQRILDALEQAPDRWVAMTDLWRVSGAFAVHSRIADLRKLGHPIEHKNERPTSGAIRSFYRLRSNRAKPQQAEPCA